MHWRTRQKYNHEMLREVWIGKSWADIKEPMLDRVTLDIELRICGQEPMDQDNAVGACKPIIDALHKLRIITNDDPETVLAVNVTQKRTPRVKAGALIRITPEA